MVIRRRATSGANTNHLTKLPEACFSSFEVTLDVSRLGSISCDDTGLELNYLSYTNVLSRRNELGWSSAPSAERQRQLLALYPDAYARRLEVLPGITGPWQIRGRLEADYQRMIELDLEYLEKQSLLLDFSILLRTLFVMLLRRGAY